MIEKFGEFMLWFVVPDLFLPSDCQVTVGMGEPAFNDAAHWPVVPALTRPLADDRANHCHRADNVIRSLIHSSQ